MTRLTGGASEPGFFGRRAFALSDYFEWQEISAENSH